MLVRMLLSVRPSVWPCLPECVLAVTVNPRSLLVLIHPHPTDRQALLGEETKQEQLRRESEIEIRRIPPGL